MFKNGFDSSWTTLVLFAQIIVPFIIVNMQYWNVWKGIKEWEFEYLKATNLLKKLCFDMMLWTLVLIFHIKINVIAFLLSFRSFFSSGFKTGNKILELGLVEVLQWRNKNTYHKTYICEWLVFKCPGCHKNWVSKCCYRATRIEDPSN